MTFRALAFFAVLAAAASTGCTPGSVIDTQSYTSPDGVEFTVTTSTCKAGIQSRNLANVAFDPLGMGIADRDASECTDPAICLCGQTCESITCVPSPGGTVQPSDCTSLANAILSTLKGTFFVSAGQTKTANFGSCEYEFGNESSGEFEYCWDDLAELGHAVSLQCPAQQAICQGGVAQVEVLFSKD